MSLDNFYNFVTPVRDMQLVIVQNVFDTCLDKTDAYRGIEIINIMLKSC